MPCGHHKGQIPANELSKHVLVKYAQTYLSEKNAEIWHYDFTDACKDHYLCHLDLEVDANGILTDEGYETLKMHLTSCKQCGERLCSETFLNNHTLDNGSYICNKAITVKFDNNEGIALEPMTVYPMDFVQRFKLPELEDTSDKEFVGWFTDNPCIMITSLSEGEFAELAYDRDLNDLEQYSEVTFTAGCMGRHNSYNCNNYFKR